MADGCTHKVVFVGVRTVGHQGMENKKNYTDISSNPLIKEGIFMSLHTTMKIGGKARFFAEINTIDDLRIISQFALANNLSIFILGGGSNTVFDDNGHDGIVIKNCLKGISILENECGATITAAAGESFDGLVEFCVSRNFGRIENLTAIPGTVGGAVVQNIGAYGTEIKNALERVEVFDLDSGTLKTMGSNELDFDYRHSVFKKDTHKNLFIISATFDLKSNSQVNVAYKDLANFFSAREVGSISVSEVREALKEIRGKKFPDMNKYGTAGSFFKNCVIDKDGLLKLHEKIPDMPFFDLEDGKVKVSAAWILDKVCNLRGYREGDLGLYENQSLVVVNLNRAKSSELKDFISKIKKKVFDEVGIILEEEVILL